jgi:predicted nucleic acid-binding protein
VILVDTSVWIRHLRVRDARLATMLAEQRVVTCDVVRGELALGSGLTQELHRALARLPHVVTPAARDLVQFIDRHKRPFRTLGVGWADVAIIVSAAGAGARLYSHDGGQRSAWRRLGLRLA